MLRGRDHVQRTVRHQLGRPGLTSALARGVGKGIHGVHFEGHTQTSTEQATPVDDPRPEHCRDVPANAAVRHQQLVDTYRSASRLARLWSPDAPLPVRCGGRHEYQRRGRFLDAIGTAFGRHWHAIGTLRGDTASVTSGGGNPRRPLDERDESDARLTTHRNHVCETVSQSEATEGNGCEDIGMPKLTAHRKARDPAPETAPAYCALW
jgi:hypothetical protein